MKCPEIAPLVARFFDGELDGRQMRSVALHITRCAGCEGDLRVLERVQDMVVEEVSAEVRDVDLSSVWTVVSEQIGDVPAPFSQRLAAWWDGLEIASPGFLGPAVAAAATVMLTFAFWPTDDVTTPLAPSVAVKVAAGESAERLVEDAVEEIEADLDNSAVFESIVGSVDRLMIDPDTHTAVLWVSDTGDLQ